ncbi:hypothetical protein KL905_001256 [Ogataea polymorpha]|uniref:uncharacterized protein n=1 Tax=Ogataea polymorpha TaxID=460523 RepID=UPI0007F4C261|nr:uncharacterized protein OGAPODRAFT_15604 [Ogataea polymorpha]KAG7879762.1 hypothetical protein KL937_002646 [Ogataea polymorpha]KAG7896849.1 hypothetical protein KL908_000251 [Ogataea polymorpha]KAG7913380.1 hypothetical protein KL907_000325 [Ogataea polymorpha]KAG7922990.1 hypothetical protein KL905_001256 [Ogataea polymorpha]KAG7937645.1 hypothetical protein KL904_001792 [Ogataea polymorpha]
MHTHRTHQLVRRCLHNRPKWILPGEDGSKKVRWADSVFGNYVRRIVEPTLKSIEMYLSDPGGETDQNAKHRSHRNEYEYLNLHNATDIKILNSTPFSNRIYNAAWKRTKERLRPHHTTLLSLYLVNGTIDQLPTIIEFLVRTRWFVNASTLLNGADMNFKDFLSYTNSLLEQQFNSDWSRKEFLRHLLREVANPRTLFQLDRKDLLADLELANQLEETYLETDYSFEVLQLHLEQISDHNSSDIIESTKLKLLINNIQQNMHDPKLQVKEFFRVADTFKHLFAKAPDTVGFFILACIPHMEKDAKTQYFSSAFFKSFLMLHITVNDVRIILDKLILNEKQLEKLWEFCKSPDMWLLGQFFQHKHYSKQMTPECFSRLPPSMQKTVLIELYSRGAGNPKEVGRVLALVKCMSNSYHAQTALHTVIESETQKYVTSIDDWLRLLQMLFELEDKLPTSVIKDMARFGATLTILPSHSSQLRQLASLLEHRDSSYCLPLMPLVLRWFRTLHVKDPDKERKAMVGDLFAKSLHSIKDLSKTDNVDLYVFGSKVPKVVLSNIQQLNLIARQLWKLDNDSISYFIGKYVDSLFTRESYAHHKVHEKIQTASFIIDMLFRLVLNKGRRNWKSFVEINSILDNYTIRKTQYFHGRDIKTRQSLIKVIDSTVSGLADKLLTGHVPRYRGIQNDQEEIGLEKLRLVCSKLEDEGYITKCSDPVKIRSMVSREDALERVRLQATVRTKMWMVHNLVSANPHLVDKVLEKYYMDYDTDIPPALIHQMMICIMESKFSFSEKLQVYRYLDKLALLLSHRSAYYVKYRRQKRATEVLIDKIISESWKEGYNHKLLISILKKKQYLKLEDQSHRWSAMLENMKSNKDGFWKEKHR